VINVAKREEDQRKNDLCLACGLCCRGLLHGRAALGDDEISRASGLGLHVLEKKGTYCFTLPCPLHVRGRCGIYDRRLRVCRAYECRLLKKWSNREIPLETAREIIDRVRDQFRRIERYFSGDEGAATLHGCTEIVRRIEEDDGTPSLRESYREFLLEFTVLRLHLDRYFYRSSEDSRPGSDRTSAIRARGTEDPEEEDG